MNNKLCIYFLLVTILLFFSSFSCLADSFYFQFINIQIHMEDYFTNLYPEYSFFYNSLLKDPVSVFMPTPWFIGYEKRFSSKSLFNHLFEIEINWSSPFSYNAADYGKPDTVWLFYLKYGVGLIKISVENIFYLKFSLFSGVGYGYHYITYLPQVPEDEQYYKKTFHYFSFFLEPRFAFGILLFQNTYLFMGYTRKITLLYSEAFNPEDRFCFFIYFEYVI